MNLSLTMRFVLRCLGVKVRKRDKTIPQNKDELSETPEKQPGQQQQTAGPQSNDSGDSEADSTSIGSAPDAVGGAEEQEDAKAGKNRDNHGRRKGDDFPDAEVCHHGHPKLKIGDFCPKCWRGKLYRFVAAGFTLITAQAPFSAIRHEIERLQCGLCKAVFRAPLPPEVVLDGGNITRRPLYAPSAVVMIVLFKYFGVMPWKRLETLQDAVRGPHIPDASMSDQSERFADVAKPVVRLLWKMAANAWLFYGDDTGALILAQRATVKPDRRSGKPTERCGCHTTCVIAVTQEGRLVVIFRIGIQHTGEVFDEVLKHRAPDLPPPLVMADASSSNEVTVCETRDCRCNSHAVRRFKDIVEDYPKEAGYALERYGKIYDNEVFCKQSGMTPEQRLAYHSEFSKTLFKDICRYGFELIESKSYDPKSPIYKAYDYLLNNEFGLSAFYRYPGAPLDNNLSETHLRLPVRLRDGAPFFVNPAGSGIAAVIFTLGVTAIKANANLFDYWVAMMRHKDDVRAHPELWLPWVYTERQEALEATLATPTRDQAESTCDDTVVANKTSAAPEAVPSSVVEAPAAVCERLPTPPRCRGPAPVLGKAECGPSPPAAPP
jgi:hypothetical protein